MKNHFYISYAGNKRNEVHQIYDNIELEGIQTIIEPYCGSCAMSYFIWLKHPNLKFILNDNNKHFLEMFNIIKDDYRLVEFEETIKELTPSLLNDKAKYIEFAKRDDVYSWYFINKFYNIRPGLFPIGPRKYSSIVNCPIVNFFKNADIEFTNMDGVKCYELYKNNPSNLILLDPPYLMSCNDFYGDPSTRIYEHLFNNTINLEEAKIYLILEKNWIIELLFKDNEKIEYEKRYRNNSKKKTTHLIIKQKK